LTQGNPDSPGNGAAIARQSRGNRARAAQRGIEPVRIV